MTFQSTFTGDRMIKIKERAREKNLIEGHIKSVN